MNIVIVGYGTQGKKRIQHIDNKSKIIAIVDPISDIATYRTIYDVPLQIYDTVFLCVPDEIKEEYIIYLAKNNKNVLVEKPLILKNLNKFNYLEKIVSKNKTIIYTAYNHRFEPNLVYANKIIKSGFLGRIYFCKLFYGNGTAKLVKNSPWRDKKTGVFSDLAPHLIDLCYFWFGEKNIKNFDLVSSFKHENNSPDHVIVNSINKKIKIQLEMTLCMWKNSFYADIIGEKGSIHINSLCKWGPSSLIKRTRKLPSGKPKEVSKIIVGKDPTWKAEFKHFNKLISNKTKSNLYLDKLILKNIFKIEKDIEAA